MENFKQIDPAEITDNFIRAIGREWMLVTAGNRESCNTMTASWGLIGFIWGRPVAQFVIRPQRYTREFVDREERATLSFFSPEYRAALEYCGSRTGRTEDKIRNAGRPVKVLNLFAYTGGATLAAAAAGAHVTHVDASKGMVAWAKENAASSGLSDKPIRWLVDDCVKFVEREIRRGNHYDAIIMDPPSYGRGPKGEIWKIEDAIHPLIKLCTQILSEDPLFFLINSYTTGLAPAVLTYMLGTELKSFHGHVDSQEIGLPVTSSGLILPCGASGRWEADHSLS